ncbi:hypothetical protein B0H19DRAFT_1124735 [Mycena capillaripes]|nr:hypothetical protein B0H19DRAFT_1124735 [Mycena capillaripes]
METNSKIMAFPALPIDLEREIFEISALSRPMRIPNLMLVAWRVKTWVEPLLYRTIVVWRSARFAPSPQPIQGHPAFYRKTLIPIIKSKRASFFRDSTRHLLVHQIPEDDTEGQFILSACSGVEDLWIFEIHPHLLPLISELPLKRLYCGLYDLLKSNQITFTHRLFSRITHLEVIDSQQELDLDLWLGLSLIPNLTHLAFNGLEFISLWPVLLDKCRSLRLLVSLWHGENGANRVAAHKDGEKLRRDTRFVLMWCEEFEKDWQMGAHASADYWARAEAFAGKRRSGEIDALECEIKEDPSLNIA